MDETNELDEHVKVVKEMEQIREHVPLTVGRVLQKQSLSVCLFVSAENNIFLFVF